MKRLAIYLKPFTSWRFTISFGVAWMLTNGWAYLFAFTPLGLPSWVAWIARGYIAFLYWPLSPEKIITIPISIWLHIKLFKNDNKTRIQLEEMHKQAKSDWELTKNKIKKLFKTKKKDM